jgi:putative ABC transport system permease protein
MRAFDNLKQDVTYAFRALRKDRGFAVTAILILALGIGAQAAVFSLVNGILLQPLEYRDSGRLFTIEEMIPQLSATYPRLPVNGGHYLEWVKRCSSCESITMINTDDSALNMTGNGDPELVSGEQVTANYFSVLGVGAEVGRSFTSDDGQFGHENVAVISDGLWHRKYGGDASVLGKSVTLDGKTYSIVGVLPAWFRAPAWDALGIPMKTSVDVLLPWPLKDSGWDELGDFDYGAVMRLKPGATAAQARAELNLIQAQIASTLKGEDKVDLAVLMSPLQSIETHAARGGLLLLLGAVGAVLLIVCVNLGNLMLARALGRTRETAVRIALGAPRASILRGVLAESLLLALTGGALGVALAVALVKLLLSTTPVNLPRLASVHVDWRVLLFAFAAALISGLVFGLVPAWRTTRVDPQEAMRSGSRGFTESGASVRLRELLVSVEVGLSCLLLIVAGLLVMSFTRLVGVNKGFVTAHVLTAQVTPAAPNYSKREERIPLYRAILAKLESEQGVTAAGLISVLPLDGQLWTDLITVPGDTRPLVQRPIASFRPISPGYFQAMGIRTIEGRTVLESDSPRMLVAVSRHTAETVWPGQDPIGKQFRNGDDDRQPYEVIGVVDDVRAVSLQEAPGLMVYVPYWDRAPSPGTFVVRTTGDATAMAGAIRDAVWSVDSQLPISKIETMDQIEERSLSQKKFQTALLAVFAGSALLLAALGTYGVLAFSVARRTNEIGIRMTLGAQSGNILGLVMRRGLWPVALGLIVGVAGALALGRLVAGLLFGVSPYDWKTIVAVLAITTVTALAACWIPARRATRVDPLVALRYE